jgi:LPS O-antigen subunit length determinant protein (WzzB/FepE family)
MPNDAGLAIACSRSGRQQKVERLETEKKQLENRIRQLKHATQTAERKRLTRAKIILGSLVLRNHVELLLQLKAEASPQDGEFLRSVFSSATKEDSPSSVQSK